MAAIMDALAGATPTGYATKSYAYPTGSVVPPAVVVGYPTTLEFDAVFGRGADRVVFPVFFVCGAVDDKAARDTVSVIVSGTHEIKAAIESNSTLLTKVDTARVTDGTFESVTIGGIAMIAVRFDVEVYS